ncbi:MAG: hypothetical protein O2856_05865 [Planctomycetota bacterium]|nr:hypothetical protein [Planctomycetota bacterium]
MRFIKLLFTAAIISMSSIAGACLNDSELPDHEREFRSQYLDSQLMTSQENPYQRSDGTLLFSAAGGVMLASAVGMTLYRSTGGSPVS